MSLQEKVAKLNLDAALATRVATFWQKAIAEHGEHKATEFYKSLGLNHLETKSVTWEGLTLSREPKENEKIAVKGVHGAQESAKESIAKILLDLRTQLITDGLKAIKKLDVADYHSLVLTVPKDLRAQLRERLIKVHKQGRMLVAAELGKKQDGQSDDEFDDLDTLTDVTDSRVINDVQNRITAAAQRFTLLGLTGAALLSAVQGEINSGSVGYIDRAAGEASNKVIALGRADEMKQRPDEIDHYLYSALLDLNTCNPCASLDGTESESLDDMPEVPLAECDGGPSCRCFVIAVAA